MTAADLAVVVVWVGLTAYAILAGADFGGGWWDLLAGNGERGRPVRQLIERSLGPVWEANHVWLIFVLVLLWTLFPPVFAAVLSTLYIPLTLAALGIIGRGSALVYRGVAVRPWQRRLLSATFGLSSVLTPFFFGAAAGAIAAGRVPPGIAAGDRIASWWNPTSVVTGVLAVAVGCYLAAVYLTEDAVRAGDERLANQFRFRAMATGVVIGGIGLIDLYVIATQSPRLWDQMSGGRGLPAVVLSFVAGIVSLILLWLRAYIAVRVSAALAVVSMIWAWGLGQYAEMLPGLTVSEAAAPDNVIVTVLGSLAVGSVLLIPSLWWLYSLAQREPSGSRRPSP